jgi:hypothetical protein
VSGRLEQAIARDRGAGVKSLTAVAYMRDENLLPPGLRGSFARYTSLGAPSVNAFAADDEEAPQEALIKLLDAAKINLQQGLAAGEQEGQPISANLR